MMTKCVFLLIIGSVVLNPNPASGNQVTDKSTDGKESSDGATPFPENMPKAAPQSSGYVNLDLQMENFNKYRGEYLRIRCEITGSPLPNYKWYHNNTELRPPKNKRHNRLKIQTTVWGSRLRLGNLKPSDSGIYSCKGYNPFGNATTSGRVVVRDEYPPNARPVTPLAPETVRPVNPGGSETKYRPPGTNGGVISFGTTEPFCQPYRGAACSKYLKGKNIYVTNKRMQGTVEQQLMHAFALIAQHTQPSPECTQHAIPALCHYAFPECEGPSSNPKPRQICRDECQALENGVCKREYRRFSSSAAHRDQFGFPDCNTLPSIRSTESRNCLRLNLLTPKPKTVTPKITYTNKPNIVPKTPNVNILRPPKVDVDCYRGNGHDYHGSVQQSRSGIPCQRWNDQSPHRHRETQAVYPELADHNYCRNPGQQGTSPWCYTTDPFIKKEMCQIPQCAFDDATKSQKKEPEDSSSNLMVIVIPSIAIPVAIATLLIVICLCHRNRRNKKGNNNRKVVKNGNNRVELNSLLTANQTKVKEFPISSIRFLQQLGEGDFGRIYQGDLIGLYAENSITRVAVKTLKEKAQPKMKNDFRREVDRMSDIKHPNILCLVGVCMKDEPWCMLFECMMHGDLHQFLTMHSPMSDVSVSDDGGEPRHLSYRDMLHISIQIASGMEYLASRQYVHKDIACRNILVGDNITCKVSDLGLSKDLYPGDYYLLQNQTLLPIRWMAPESIVYGKFSIETDIWSYGVTLWEIHSHGLQPYFGYNNQDVMDMIRTRQILPCPDECPSRVYSLMVECWQENASRRPNFREIHTRLIGWMGETMGQMGQVPQMSGSGSCHTSSHHSSHHSSTGPSNNTATTLMTPSTNQSQSPVPMMGGHMGSANAYGSTPVHCSSPPPFSQPYNMSHAPPPNFGHNVHFQGNANLNHPPPPQGAYNIVTPGYTNTVFTNPVVHKPSPPPSVNSHKTPSHSSSRSSSLANYKQKSANNRHSDKKGMPSPEIEELKQSDI